MSIYVSSSNLVLIPEAALSHWKPYGAGELTGAIISGKDSAEIIKELNQSSILPFTSFFYRKHFVILFPTTCGRHCATLLGSARRCSRITVKSWMSKARSTCTERAPPASA